MLFKMDALPPGYSILFKFFSRMVQVAFGLLVLAWLGFIFFWAAIHWVIVPRIGEFRPFIETQATQTLGVPVRIGSIRAESKGIIPSFELRDISLLDPLGREALRLPKVLASLSPRSLWNLGFEQLYIDQPEIDIRRDTEGKIWLAGLDFFSQLGLTRSVGDWFFSQNEFALRGGTISWKDDSRQEPALLLTNVDFVVRNKLRQHALRLDATPPEDLGQRFSLMAKFRQPLLVTHAGDWRRWDGQLYAAFDKIDLGQLRRYFNPGLEVIEGHGGVRAWLDISQGKATGISTDVSLADVRMGLNTQSAPVSLPFLSSRLTGRITSGGFEVATQNLKFETQEGLHWPGGNFQYSHKAADGRKPQAGELKAEQLDLAAVSRIASQLPLELRWRDVIKSYAAKGLVERFSASWQLVEGELKSFEAKGRVVQLGLAARTSSVSSPGKTPVVHLLSPGVAGAAVEFDMSQSGGRASVTLADGRIELPGVFDEPVIEVKLFSSDVKWQLQSGRIAIQMPNIKFSNDDALGDAQVKWQSADPSASSQTWGVLDLQGTMSRASVARVARYLPQVMDLEVREYLRNALQQGQASAVKFKVKGDLDQFPFPQPGQGEFKVSASVRDAGMTYVPRYLQSAGELPWPALTQINGELLIDRTRLQVKDANAKIAGATGLRISRADALIANYLNEAVVRVNLEARGPLAEALGVVVNGSPLGALSGKLLSKAQATGNADYQVTLNLPLLKLEKSSLQGKVVFSNNDLQIYPEIPRVTRVRGTLNFTESGAAISSGVGRMLGGDLRAEGGTIPLPTQTTASLRIQGAVTAEGLRLATELGALSRWAKQASGSTTYAATVSMRRSVPEILLTSNLQGLALNLPAPLNKSAEGILPLRIETTLLSDSSLLSPGAALRLEDQLRIDLGRVVSAVFTRDVSRPQVRVLRGGLGVGLLEGESLPAPVEGVAANINFTNVDLDAWSELWTSTMGDNKVTGPSSVAGSFDREAYMPSTLAIRANELTYSGRKLNGVVVGGSRQGPVWRANVLARELNGYLEYREASAAGPGRVYARLARLSLAQANAKDVESLLDEQPLTIPALDIVVDDLELRGKKFGRLEIEAINRSLDSANRDGVSREWRLNKFNVTLPEAALTASGNWALVNEQKTSAQRKTAMNFKLDISDAGELLERFGMKEVVRKGKGKIEGQIAWLGSPLALDYPSLAGAFVVSVESGQFLKADPGIAKLLGVLSLQSLPRRLALDFRDVFSEGFSFDFVRGDVTVRQGIAETRNLQMKGVNAVVLMEGSADIERETQNLKVVVVPEINAGTASLLATWINPAVGLSTFLAQLILRRPLMDSVTQEFQIDGSWTDPKVTRLDSKSEPKKDTRNEGLK